MSGDNEARPEQVRPVKLIFDDNSQASVYATNITVQHSPHEFIISFYEARPPLVMGTPEERERQMEAIEHVFASCVARVTVAASRMDGFVNALKGNYESYLRNFVEKERGDE